MGETPHCLDCGAVLPVGTGICARCLDRADLSLTEAYLPGEQAVILSPSASLVTVSCVEFRRAAIELGLLDAKQLDRATDGGTADDVSALAGKLVQANGLTAYQAAALAQGKGRGLIVGPYLVLYKRGQGGMGVVFKARHRPTGLVIALKILPPAFGRDNAAVQRFRREVEAAARLDHPNIVKILDASQDRGVHFLAMEFIAGRDLRSIVSSDGPLPIDQVIDCTIQAARGLEAAHAKGIVHRDIKPANLMLDASGVVRVLDLGLARLTEASGPMGSTLAGSVTATGSYIGTVDYSAPEQADDAKTVDHRADIYSLGCTIHYLATGRPPFEGDSVIKKLMAHQNRPAPSLHSARPDVPARLEAAYQVMTAKQPADRPQSMNAVIWMLEGIGQPAVTKPKSRAELITFVDGQPAVTKPKSRAELITFVDGKPMRTAPSEPGRSGAVASPARLRPGDDRPSSLDPGVDPLASRALPSEEGQPPDLPKLPPGPKRSRPWPRSWGRWAFAALAVLGAILAWAARSPRAPRSEPEPAPEAVAEEAGTPAPPAGPAPITTAPPRPPAQPTTTPPRRGEATLVLRPTPAEAEAPASAGENAGADRDRGRADRSTVRMLPNGFRAKLEGGVNEAGWPLVIVGERDGGTMVLIPGATFIMGKDGGPPDDGPAHPVRLSTFYVDQHEVTNRQFRTFLRETRYLGVPPGKWLTDEKLLAMPENAPTVYVSYQDAEAYALWALKRLPTEAQWELAARSVEGRRHPWGDGPVSWSRPRQFGQIDPVMSFPEDVSAFGVFDLAGNAMEWVRDWYDPRYFDRLRDKTTEDPSGPPARRQGIRRAVRGSSEDWLVYDRRGMDSDSRLANLGFRSTLAVEGGEAAANIVPRTEKPRTPPPGAPAGDATVPF